MFKIVYFDYAAIILLLAILITSVVKKMTRGRPDLFFFLITGEILITAITGVVTLNLDNAGAGHLVLKYVFHSLYLFFHAITSFFYLIYLISLTDTWHKVKNHNLLKITLYFPVIVTILLLTINVFYPFLFYFDSNDVYTRKNLFVLIYLIALYYLTFGILYIIYYRKLFTREMILTVMLLYPFTIFSVIFEAIFPQIVIEIYMNSICLIFISTIIHHPDYLLNIDTGFGNNLAFEEDLKRNFSNEKEFQMIIINVTNYRTLRNVIGYFRRPKLSTLIAEKISYIEKKYKLHGSNYYLKNGQFRVVLGKKDFDKVYEAAEEMNKISNTPFLLDNIEINLITNICIIKYPEEIDTYNSLMIFCNDLRSPKYFNQKVLLGSKLYDKQYYSKVGDINEIIERGFSEKNFYVVYQPIYSIKEKRFTSAEALLRLEDKEYGFISPEIFIPAAETSGAIHKIGVFVMEEVCKFISSPEFQNLGVDYIEVNLSVAQCMKDNLASTVLQLLDEYKVSPKTINLEITETALSQSQEKFVKNINELVNSGISISLDDFGSGYSNLQRISQLPFQIVKLDKSFITQGDSKKINIILKNIINMVRSLDIKIVIEGVETKEILDNFIELQCDYVQGFYFSRPKKKTDFIEFIKKQ